MAEFGGQRFERHYFFAPVLLEPATP
jgi:hypothetical protein